MGATLPQPRRRQRRVELRAARGLLAAVPLARREEARLQAKNFLSPQV